MSRPVASVVVVVCLVTAGCLGAVTGDGEPVTSDGGPVTSDGGPGTTTSNCPPPANLTTGALPEPPANLTRARVKSFVRKYAAEDIRNDLVRDGARRVGVGISSVEVVTANRTGYLVIARGSANAVECRNGEKVFVEGGIRARYLVNGTTVVGR